MRSQCDRHCPDSSRIALLLWSRHEAAKEAVMTFDARYKTLAKDLYQVSRKEANFAFYVDISKRKLNGFLENRKAMIILINIIKRVTILT